MPASISLKERDRLRRLAFRQRELAESPSSRARIAMWRALNDNGSLHPPVAVETWTFDPEFLPPEVFECESDVARTIEYSFLSHIRREEYISDDQPVPDAFYTSWDISIDRFGLPSEITVAADRQGRTIAYHQEPIIHDLPTELSKLRPAAVSVDKTATLERKAWLESLFGDILPVKIAGPPLEIHLTSHLISLLGMEYLYTSIYDYPEEIEVLMRYITDNERHILRFYEENDLLRPDDLYRHIATSYLSSDNAASADNSAPAHRNELWGWAEAEETAGLSPQMFIDLFLPYYRQPGADVGRLYYGCCEPLQDTLTDILKALPNIGKVSISPWSDESRVGAILRGTGVIYSRKPSANLIGVAQTLDEAALCQHIAATLAAAEECPCEFIFRDIYTVHGNLQKIRRAVELTKQVIQQAGR